jgi:hypothetical protein
MIVGRARLTWRGRLAAAMLCSRFRACRDLGEMWLRSWFDRALKGEGVSVTDSAGNELFMSEIVRSEPDDGAYLLTLACGHVVWSPAGWPGSRIYCGGCVADYLDRYKAGKLAR